MSVVLAHGNACSFGALRCACHPALAQLRITHQLRSPRPTPFLDQLDGGVHRYLEEFKEDGGHWKGKNYTFDKRFGHGADNAECISECVHCGEPWERYQANAKCTKCKMEVLFCRRCQRTPKKVPKSVRTSRDTCLASCSLAHTADCVCARARECVCASGETHFPLHLAAHCPGTMPAESGRI